MTTYISISILSALLVFLGYVIVDTINQAKNK